MSDQEIVHESNDIGLMLLCSDYVIGAALTQQEIADRIQPGHFNDPFKAALWQAILACREENLETDPLTVAAKFIEITGHDLTNFGREYIVERSQHGTSGNLAQHQEKMLELAEHGQLIYGPSYVAVDQDYFFDGAAEPPAFLVEGLLPRGEVALFASHGGLGKTMLSLVIANFLAAERQVFNLKSEPAKVLFMSLEDRGEKIKYRCQNIRDYYQISREELGDRFILRDGTIGDRSLIHQEKDGSTLDTPMMKNLKIDIMKHRPDLVIIDNISYANSLGEIDRQAVHAFIMEMESLARLCGSAVLLLGHVNRMTSEAPGKHGQHFSGSSAWNNAVRSRFALIPDPDTGGIKLVHEKCNDGKLIDPINLMFGINGVIDLHRGSFQDETDRGSDLLPAIQSLIKVKGYATANMDGGRYTLQSALQEIVPEALTERYKGRAGRRAIRAAAYRLIKDGKVKIDDESDTNRHSRRRLKPV